MARVLIIEDDRQLSNLVVDFLNGEGHQIEPAYKGTDGLERLRTGSYDLVILDWELPGLSGVDLCQQYRDSGGQTLILMLTGKRELEDKEIGLDSGADDYLTKPFHLKELSARMRALLRRKTKVAESSDGSIQTGQIVAGKFRLDQFIAQGGMALIYRATHIGMNKTVVVKVLQEHLINSAKQRTRFERECLTMAKINHINVATVFDAGVTDHGRPYLVMEYVKGVSLADRLDRDGALPLEDAVKVLDQICRGLEEVHAAGIIHRDLKPDNILLQENKERPDWVKIVDFGIAHLVDADRRLTDADKVVGTAGFMAPEQLRSEEADCRTDVYALGVMFFQMITNQLPFKAKNTEAMLLRQFQTEPDLLSDYLPQLGKDSTLDLFKRKALAIDPRNRYQTVTEMRLALQYVLPR
jgi:serine/threonine protein kinase